mmetsp:Transcript_8764/g.14318  ORF Transcript_8764/g.14318 Transcript_8764/m.14318 type:complete len:99 (+) Transcript_8764:39-335(+)
MTRMYDLRQSTNNHGRVIWAEGNPRGLMYVSLRQMPSSSETRTIAKTKESFQLLIQQFHNLLLERFWALLGSKARNWISASVNQKLFKVPNNVIDREP